MPEPYMPRPAALWDALKAAGTTPSSKRKAALLDALKVENRQPQGPTTPQGMAEFVKTTS